MNIDFKAFAKCSKCARWTKPLKTSACNPEESETLIFKENDDGKLYCDDFQPVLS